MGDVGERLAVADPAKRGLQADHPREGLRRDADVGEEPAFELAQADAGGGRDADQIDASGARGDRGDGGVDSRAGARADEAAEPRVEQARPARDRPAPSASRSRSVAVEPNSVLEIDDAVR